MQRWALMGRDTFAREDFVVATFDTREEAEAAMRVRDARLEKTQDAALRDESWVVPVTSLRR